MADEQFKNAESEYFRLKGLLAAGRITKDQFEQSLQKLAIQDAQGRQWILGVDDGKWYVLNGRSWVQADPYRNSPPAFTTRLHRARCPPRRGNRTGYQPSRWRWAVRS